MHGNEEGVPMNTSRSTVVVGVDGTTDGERAVWYGTALATREDLDLRLVHVPQETEFAGGMLASLPIDTVREIGHTVLRDAAKQAEEAGFDEARTTTVLSEGTRTTALLRQAEDARHIVLGTRASAIQHLLTGRTTLSVVAHSSVPVHCVPRSWSAQRSPSGRLVVGVDGSQADPEVLAEAFAEASNRGASLEILHAWRPVSPYDAAITGRVLRDDWDKTTREALTRRVEEVTPSHPGVEWVLRLEFERVPVALHDAAVNADLLVLGRHGHHPLLGLLVGSNTRTLVHTAPCPVVVVPVSSDDQ
jgi:nucleotide-binding universal stress UspA family protein